MSESFKLDKEFVEEIKDYVSSGDEAAIYEKVNHLHPADIAEILDLVNMEEAKFVYRRLDEEIASDVLVELEERYVM